MYDIKEKAIFSIPSGVAFLENFVQAFLNNMLIKKINAKDPLILANTIIYVPTRRAARSLRSTFAKNISTRATLLPTICPLGGEEEEDFFCNFLSINAENSILSPIKTTEREILLAHLIQSWREKLPIHIRNIFGREKITMPTNAADALWLARDLASLIDDIETEEVDWTKLKNIVPDMVAEWWQVTLEFLQIIIKNWPNILRERGVVDPAMWRTLNIRREIQKITSRKFTGPVLTAGITSFIPAIAELVRIIANLPIGAVILPGLDRDLDEESWRILGKDKDDPSIFGHPQYGLKKLLDYIGVPRSSIVHIGTLSDDERTREEIVSQIFRPAETTDTWSKFSQNFSKKEIFHNVTLVEATNEREEALVIALALRAAIEEKNKTAAFVTSDRTLARRVSSELDRFGIQADDSAGTPLSESKPATLIRLLLSCIFEPGSLTTILSLLKHPLVRVGEKRLDFLKEVEWFELFALRGGKERIIFAKIDNFIQRRLHKIARQKRYLGEKIFSIKMVRRAIAFGKRLIEVSTPLLNLLDEKNKINIAKATIATIKCFENFGRDENGTLNDLYAYEEGECLIRFLRILTRDKSGFKFFACEWPKVFTALIAEKTIQLRYSGHPRLYIWGAFEARLQWVDTIIVGGMNEGLWPEKPENNPFLSRTMKKTLNLAPPERRIGIIAHDFQMLLGMKRIVLTRSLKVKNTPSVPSRWLQRLFAVLGEKEIAAIRKRGTFYLHWAHCLDFAKDVPFISRPCPVPPLSSRPQHFSVTEIEVLRRNPYAIYAKKILCLKALEPLIGEPSVRERGILYHTILSNFTDNDVEDMEQNGLNRLLQIAKREFDKLQLPDDIRVIWWYRFLLIAPKFFEWEVKRKKIRRFTEVVANPTLVGNTGIKLSGRADRIDLSEIQSAEIIDFKTGSFSSKKKAVTLLAPQLALEGALLTNGAFRECTAITLKDLLYVRLGSKANFTVESIINKNKTSFTFCSEAWQKLEELLEYYNNAQTGYLSYALPPTVTYENEYDHLARVQEWSALAAKAEE